MSTRPKRIATPGRSLQPHLVGTCSVLATCHCDLPQRDPGREKRLTTLSLRIATESVQNALLGQTSIPNATATVKASSTTGNEMSNKILYQASAGREGRQSACQALPPYLDETTRLELVFFGGGTRPSGNPPGTSRVLRNDGPFTQRAKIAWGFICLKQPCVLQSSLRNKLTSAAHKLIMPHHPSIAASGS